jgi:hypothetical protein
VLTMAEASADTNDLVEDLKVTFSHRWTVPGACLTRNRRGSRSRSPDSRAGLSTAASRQFVCRAPGEGLAAGRS